MERFHIVGTNLKACGVEGLSGYSLNKTEQEQLGRILVEAGMTDPVILSTCHRVEVLHTGPFAEPELIFKAFEKVKGRNCPDFDLDPQDFVVVNGRKAVEHLFRLASGLDSLVIGEPQIFGQVKESFAFSVEQGWIEGHAARLLYDAVMRVGKRVRSETDVGSGSVSVAVAAIRILQERVGDLSDKKVLIIGAGKIGRLAALHFASKANAQISIANRTRENAEQLAREVSAKEVLDIGSLQTRLADFDVIVGAVDTDEYLLTRADFEAIEGPRPSLVDVSVPPCLDPDIALVSGVSLVDMRMLRDLLRVSRRRRTDGVRAAERIIDHGLDVLEVKLWESGEVRPVVKQMRRKIGYILSSVFPNAEEEDVQRATNRIVNFHVARLKDINTALEEKRRRLEVIGEIFASRE